MITAPRRRSVIIGCLLMAVLGIVFVVQRASRATEAAQSFTESRLMVSKRFQSVGVRLTPVAAAIAPAIKEVR